MRKIIITAIVLVLLFFLIPLSFAPNKPDDTADKTPEAPAVTQVFDLQSGRMLRVLQGEAVSEMDLNQYLWGVVAAEMPASFEEEALKAQAVAARTYAMQRAQWVNQKHPTADVCGDHRCCQAYITPEKAAQNWGANAEAYTQKILNAVSGTAREVILYDGKLISALFHSSSAGQTLDSVQVWGNSVPYLVAVESPEGEGVPNYETELKLSPADFRAKFLAKYPHAVLEGSPSSWFTEEQRSAGGSVVSLVVGGVPVKGPDMRSLLYLRSAAFEIVASDSELIFRVTGFGHGVGLSQYGANALAKDGKPYRDILLWYYSGVSVENCPDALWTAVAK